MPGRHRARPDRQAHLEAEEAELRLRQLQARLRSE